MAVPVQQSPHDGKAAEALLLQGIADLPTGAVEVVVAQFDGRFGAVDADLVEDGLVALLVPGGAGAEG